MDNEKDPRTKLKDFIEQMADQLSDMLWGYLTCYPQPHEELMESFEKFRANLSELI